MQDGRLDSETQKKPQLDWYVDVRTIPLAGRFSPADTSKSSVFSGGATGQVTKFVKAHGNATA